MINTIRFSTLLHKECMRFIKVYNQTILSPVINAIIFFAIFTIAFGERGSSFTGVPYSVVVATGLMMMSALQAAFQNTQATITISKMLGFIKDYTITPLTNVEIISAMIVAAVARSLLVSAITFLAVLPFVDFNIHSILLTLYYLIMGSIIFAFMGIVIGFVSSDFDKAHAYTAYIVTPLTMLSGTFYSISSLPESWQKVIFLNPVFYIIEGFRFGMTGAGTHHWFGFIMVLALVPIFGIWATKILLKGMYESA